MSTSTIKMPYQSGSWDFNMHGADLSVATKTISSAHFIRMNGIIIAYARGTFSNNVSGGLHFEITSGIPTIPQVCFLVGRYYIGNDSGPLFHNSGTWHHAYLRNPNETENYIGESINGKTFEIILLYST